MFYYIQGIVAHVAPYLAVLDCSGVGYACKTTNHTLAALTRGKSAKLYTHLYVREEIMELYGFISESELNCFEMLIGVSGVGPKAALAILSAATPDQLALAVVTGDEKTLTAAPGIGKKIAQRIILELKDKMAKQTGGEIDLSGGKGAPAAAALSSKASDAAQALAVLGYSGSEISAALKGVDVEHLSLEEIVRQSLKKMVK